jgi:L-tartrate/succinate antiporter
MKPIIWKSILPLFIGIVIAVVPGPEGLSVMAWYYFAIFAAVVIALVLEPIPVAAVGVIGVTLAAVSGLVEAKPGNAIRWALSGFSNTTVWLIFGAFMFALGYQKTGLGKRIALALVKVLGKRTLGLGYAITLSDLILAPFTPSNTARSGGTIFPVIRNIPPLYGSEPGETSRKIGSYLMWTALAATCVTSSMFITSLAPNLLALELVKKTVKLDISWTTWFVGFLPVGVILIIVLPFLIYKLYPPQIKISTEAHTWAAEEMKKMGKISRQEIVMALLAIVALALWIFGKDFIDATTVALVVISLMVVTGIVKWNDILDNKPAWNVLAWFATLVTLADGLYKVGFVTWFAKNAAAHLAGMSTVTVMVVLVVLFFLVHYMFASITAHTTAVLPVLLAAGAAIPGVPVKIFALLLCYSLGIMGIITPYATGPSPVYFGSGFISRRDFWILGLVFGFIYLLALLVIGIPYLMAINP